MNQSILSQFKAFFGDQVKDAIREQQKINHTPICELLKTEHLSIGYVESVEPTTGMVILKFPRYQSPRLKIQRSLVVTTRDAYSALGPRPYDWACKWEDYADNPDFHSSESNCIPMHFVSKKDSRYEYVACSGISTAIYDLFTKTTAQGRSLTVMVYTPFPPLDYYRNLSSFMDKFPNNKELFLECKINYEDWLPKELAYDNGQPNGISDTILQTLEAEDACIIQGPPGSGKSYTVAMIAAEYLKANKSVCVTTMANKGLIELIKQPPLQSYVKAGRISKTNLSSDEHIQIPGLLAAKSNDLHASAGQLICATNYVLSGVYSDNNHNTEIPSYDLIIIEEASQAFLTTIAAFKQLGKKCIIVGDPMQLPPIVNALHPWYNSWNVDHQIEGLKHYILGSDIPSFRIMTTFRLTQSSANCTKIFYGNNFASVRQDYLDYSFIQHKAFPKDGGVVFHCTGDVRNGVYSESASAIISHIVNLLERHYPKRSLAIITPFKDSVKELQKRFSIPEINLDITIETVDRIQGMTVDYAIFYLPARNPSFALEARRFNVATSRSKSTTLLISDLPFNRLHSIPSSVLKFLDRCKPL